MIHHHVLLIVNNEAFQVCWFCCSFLLNLIFYW